MPKCEKCLNFYPPNYTKIIPDKGVKEDGTMPQQCVFCELSIDSVEIEFETGKYRKYTKEECITDYKKFIRKMKDQGSVKDILKASENKKFGVI